MRCDWSSGTFGLFIVSLYGLYFTPVFDDLMGTWWGHNLVLMHLCPGSGIPVLRRWPLARYRQNPERKARGRTTQMKGSSRRALTAEGQVRFVRWSPVWGPAVGGAGF
jgi:hypothetical protein